MIAFLVTLIKTVVLLCLVEGTVGMINKESGSYALAVIGCAGVAACGWR